MSSPTSTTLSTLGYTSLDTLTTRKLLSLPDLIEALRKLFKEGCVVPPRHVHQINSPTTTSSSSSPQTTLGTVLLMPAWREGKRMGIKTVTIFPENPIKYNKPGLHSMYTLFDANTGEPLLQLDGNEITSRRTAAASALAASFLARQNAQTLLVVGAGRVASLTYDAMKIVRPSIQQVLVWDLFPKTALLLVDELKKRGVNVKHVEHLQAGVEAADIVSCATLSRNTPLIQGSWLRPGTHLDLIGAFTPEMTEADPQCFAKSSVYTDTLEPMIKAGDVLNAMKAGTFDPKLHHKGTLESMCRGQSTYLRKNNDEITLFKSVGTALEDLAAAELCYEKIFGKNNKL
jgi:ornithine cyclodeaminase/alanine dehydrogenase-like protein (mu-crystallin family)